MSLQNQPANSTFNDIYYAGFMKLLLTYNQNRIIPETFRLDKSRIVTFYNEWQVSTQKKKKKINIIYFFFLKIYLYKKLINYICIYILI